MNAAEAAAEAAFTPPDSSSPGGSSHNDGHEPRRRSQGEQERKAHLPLEILPHILGHLRWRTRDLAQCCLVSQTWKRYAQPRLYARLFLRDQRKLIRLFASLEGNRSLASLVRILEIRVFPFGLRAEELEGLEASILSSLQYAVNLNELYWTRTGSLTDRVIPFLPVLPQLHTLELTGSSRFYTPSNITKHLLNPRKTPSLRHFSVVLPDREVATELVRWAEAMGAKLTSFSVLCQHSAFVNDDTLKALAVHLTGLSRLSVAGCKAVTAEGISALLKTTRKGIRELAIEGLAVHPESFVNMAKYLKELKLLSLTFPRQNLCPTSEFWHSLGQLVEDLPNLEELTHYTSSWNTPKGMYTDTLDSDEDDLRATREDEEALGEGRNDEEEHDGRRAATRYTGTSPQEYRRHELEEHAQNGRPIVREPRLSTAFVRRLVNARGELLKKVRIHGIVATMEQISMITSGCPNIRDLVIHPYEGDRMDLQRALMHVPHLESLHILSSLYSDFYLSEESLRAIAAHCSTALRQIGFRNRVWLVERQTPPIGEGGRQALTNDQVSSVVPLPDGRLLVLRRWDMSAGTFPEVLLVVRACKCPVKGGVKLSSWLASPMAKF